MEKLGSNGALLAQNCKNADLIIFKEYAFHTLIMPSCQFGTIVRTLLHSDICPSPSRCEPSVLENKENEKPRMPKKRGGESCGLLSFSHQVRQKAERHERVSPVAGSVCRARSCVRADATTAIFSQARIRYLRCRSSSRFFTPAPMAKSCSMNKVYM